MLVYFTNHLGRLEGVPQADPAWGLNPSKTLGIQIFASSGTVGHHEADLGTIIARRLRWLLPGTLNNQFLMDGNGKTPTFYDMISSHPTETNK